jgi:hypothetical protein
MATKKSKIKYVDPGPQSYKTWNVGDYVYCNRFPDDRPAFGRITSIHLKDASGRKGFTFADEVSGQYRMALFSNIVDDPSSKMKSARRRADASRAQKPKKK